MGTSGPQPPFYRRPVGPRGGAIDDRVLDVAEPLWRACLAEVRRVLGDEQQAAPIVESVSESVSRQLTKNQEVGRNLAGYFYASFLRHVRGQAVRDGRICYCGLGHELEHFLALRDTTDWPSRIEARIFLQQLAGAMTPEAKLLLSLRLLDWPWKTIAGQLKISEVQARTRFYRGLKNALEQLQNGPGEH